MSEVHGTYFDGQGSQGLAATIRVQAGRIVVESAGVVVDLDFSQLKIDSRLGTTPRRITWGNHESFVAEDNDRVDLFAQQLPHGDHLGWVVWLEERMLIALTALVLVVGCGVGFAVWGVPAIAEYAAHSIPDEISDQLGDATLSNIGEILESTDLSQERQEALREYFSAHGSVNRIEFRNSKLLGANAFALSCTTLTFTDDLVELASDDEELLAVYLHELGHARLRHVERSLLQSSAWLVMLTLITGDLSGVGELILSLPLVIGQTAYSREFERAADEFAVDALIEAGVSPLKLATILERLEQSHMQRRSQPDSAHKQGEAQANPEKSVDEAAFEDEERVERDRVEDAADSRSRDVSTEADEVSTEDVAAKPSQVARVLFDYLSTHPATSERVAYIKSRAAQL